MKLIDRVVRFARSPQGRRAAAAPHGHPPSPHGPPPLEQARKQIAARGGKRRKPR